VPIYDEIPHRKAHLVDPEVEKLKRQINMLQIRERQREEDQRATEEVTRRNRDEEERARRRERKKKEQEKLRRQEENERKKGLEAKLRSTNQDFEEGDSKKKLEKEVRAAMEYMSARKASREIAGRKEDSPSDGVDDAEHILLAIKQFVEQRLQRQERLGIEERSVGTNYESRRGKRLEIAPFEPRVDIVTRTQIEDIVIDVLQRVGVRAKIQDTASAWEKSMTFSGRLGQDNRSTRSAKSANYESRHDDELEVRPRSVNRSSFESRQSNPMTPDSQGQFSDRTAVDTSNRYQPIEIDKGSIQLRNPPGPREEFTRKPALRVKTSAPLNDNFPEINDHSAEDEYQSAKKYEHISYTTQNVAGGNETTRRRLEKESKRRRWRETVVEDTDELEEQNMFPRRSGQYSGKPPHGSRRHRVGNPPPSVPDAPQGEGSPKLARHKASVATDVED
jgi:hypothetical protein